MVGTLYLRTTIPDLVLKFGWPGTKAPARYTPSPAYGSGWPDRGRPLFDTRCWQSVALKLKKLTGTQASAGNALSGTGLFRP